MVEEIDDEQEFLDMLYQYIGIQVSLVSRILWFGVTEVN